MRDKSAKKVSITPVIWYLIEVFSLSALYFITGRTGLTVGTVNTFATLVWPPTGIAFAALLLFGYKLWPAVAIGAFLVNFATGASVPIALGIAVGNTLEAIIGVFLVRK